MEEKNPVIGAIGLGGESVFCPQTIFMHPARLCGQKVSSWSPAEKPITKR